MLGHPVGDVSNRLLDDFVEALDFTGRCADIHIAAPHALKLLAEEHIAIRSRVGKVQSDRQCRRMTPRRLSRDEQIQMDESDRHVLIAIDGGRRGGAFRHDFLEDQTGFSRNRFRQLQPERQHLIPTARVLIRELRGGHGGRLPQMDRQWKVIADMSAVTAAEEPAPSQ